MNHINFYIDTLKLFQKFGMGQFFIRVKFLARHLLTCAERVRESWKHQNRWWTSYLFSKCPFFLFQQKQLDRAIIQYFWEKNRLLIFWDTLFKLLWETSFTIYNDDRRNFDSLCTKGYETKLAKHADNVWIPHLHIGAFL